MDKSAGTPILFKVGDKVALHGFWFGTGTVIEIDYENASCGGMMIYRVDVGDHRFWFSNEELTLIDSGTVESK